MRLSSQLCFDCFISEYSLKVIYPVHLCDAIQEQQPRRHDIRPRRSHLRRRLQSSRRVVVPAQKSFSERMTQGDPHLIDKLLESSGGSVERITADLGETCDDDGQITTFVF